MCGYVVAGGLSCRMMFGFAKVVIQDYAAHEVSARKMRASAGPESVPCANVAAGCANVPTMSVRATEATQDYEEYARIDGERGEPVLVAHRAVQL
jgi:hypothetical protein